MTLFIVFVVSSAIVETKSNKSDLRAFHMTIKYSVFDDRFWQRDVRARWWLWRVTVKMFSYLRERQLYHLHSLQDYDDTLSKEVFSEVKIDVNSSGEKSIRCDDNFQHVQYEVFCILKLMTELKRWWRRHESQWCALIFCWFHTSRFTILNSILHLKILYHDLITPKVLILFATVLESYSASLISNHLTSKWYGQSLSHYLNEIFSLNKFLMLKNWW